MSAPTLEYGSLGSETAVFTAANLSALANNARSNSSITFNNAQGQPLGGHPFARLKWTEIYQTAPTANTGWSLFYRKSSDGGVTFGDSISVRGADLTIPVGADTITHTDSLDVPIPLGYFTITLLNDGTGQAIGNSTFGNSSITLAPWTYQLPTE